MKFPEAASRPGGRGQLPHAQERGSACTRAQRRPDWETRGLSPYLAARVWSSVPFTHLPRGRSCRWGLSGRPEAQSWLVASLPRLSPGQEAWTISIALPEIPHHLPSRGPWVSFGFSLGLFLLAPPLCSHSPQSQGVLGILMDPSWALWI